MLVAATVVGVSVVGVSVVGVSVVGVSEISGGLVDISGGGGGMKFVSAC